MESRQERLSSIYDELEANLTLLGITAVEDQLQEGVAETMTALRQAGICLWVLTGTQPRRGWETACAALCLCVPPATNGTNPVTHTRRQSADGHQH